MGSYNMAFNDDAARTHVKTLVRLLVTQDLDIGSRYSPSLDFSSRSRRGVVLRNAHARRATVTAYEQPTDLYANIPF